MEMFRTMAIGCVNGTFLCYLIQWSVMIDMCSCGESLTTRASCPPLFELSTTLQYNVQFVSHLIKIKVVGTSVFSYRIKDGRNGRWKILSFFFFYKLNKIIDN